MQSEPSVTPVAQAPKKFNSMIIVVVVLVLALIGVGVWGFQQNSALKTTQADLTTLQGKYDSLTTDHTKTTADLEAANTELTSTKGDLEKAQSDLASKQDDLKKAQDKNTDLQNKNIAASKKADILFAVVNIKTSTDLFKVDSMIKDTKDTALISEWSKFTSNPTAENSTNFLLYLIEAVKDTLK